ncbi:MAG: PEP/pyruvate-binding domain-containing protein [Eggerthellaceae bacterium]|jgi:pyruvate,water dikinase
MATFERIPSGIKGIDRIFDNIRLGDNVVWQLTSLAEFSCFVDPFVKQSVDDGRTMVYIRFAGHPELVPDQPGVKRYTLNPHKGFESFTVAVREIITREGPGVFYVFDCLSELQAAWSADLMMGNFFRLTCPYLYELDTVAYFPMIRGAHSFETIAKIRDTTQLLIDVMPDEVAPDGTVRSLFVHPLKVWNRFSNTMFLAHRLNLSDQEVVTLTNGVDTARFFERMNEEDDNGTDQNIDSWDRFFMDARRANKDGSLDEETCTKMCNMMMTKDPKMRAMVKRYFKPEDYFTVRNRMVGTGLIGGKACGMLLARKIIEAEIPEYVELLEPHDSFYVGTDVFYTYIVSNNLWPLRIKQRNHAGFVSAAPALKKGIEEGEFPDSIREQFQRILEYFGQSPIIVRSSSFLEDGFGNAFAGKYESVFCPNGGRFETRLIEFENAVRRVYASTMDPSALEYRLRNGLDDTEEQMALLVQRVSGSRYGDECFMPTAAGVGYSHSAYCWMDEMDPDAGMLRLVMGLGTKAVDRTGTDYPRILSLDRPLATTAKTVAEKHRYSQRYANFIDLEKRTFSERPCLDLAPLLPAYAQNAVLEHDREAERTLSSRGAYQPVLFASCEGLAANQRFIDLMHAILSTLQQAYQNPVDIEFTVNVGDDDRFIVNLLQCRPLQSFADEKRVKVPVLETSDTLLHLKGASMGNMRESPIDTVIHIDPEAYYRCPHGKKTMVPRIIGIVNEWLKDTGRHALLLSPGRIGTSSPELGVPVTFAEISDLEAICEIAYSGAGYSPELSYGSHLFQDLVEADIFYGAVFENEKTITYRPNMLNKMPDLIDDILSRNDDAGRDLRTDPDLAGIVRVADARDAGLMLWHDMIDNETVCGVSPNARIHRTMTIISG